ncbi:uncharacterized protein LOC115053439 isoform X2 [Echeneis naucrates]|nr:uncharacterized protein LOC115053439 isoform X2 [Echeneis naucrates]XP_029374013.1 uncharacterized protein LOC115053439 isoform X2 [Echeneis naucrates]
MADRDCSTLSFVSVLHDAFYFTVGDSDLEEDAYKVSQRCIIRRLHSNDDKILLLSDDGKFEALQLTKEEQEKNECKFNIQFCDKSFNDLKKGRPVIVFVKDDNRKKLACCKEKNEVYPKAMEIPEEIDSMDLNVLFYLTQLQGTKKYMFESLAFKGKFLGFEPVSNSDHMSKLVLVSKAYDVPDDACEFSLTS